MHIKKYLKRDDGTNVLADREEKTGHFGYRKSFREGLEPRVGNLTEEPRAGLDKNMSLVRSDGKG